MCFGNTRDALDFLSVPGGFSGIQEPIQLCGPSTSRASSKTSSSMLPTIDEDEELTACGSPTSSTTSSCRSPMAVPDRSIAGGFQPELLAAGHWEHQQCTDVMQMGTDQPEMEEMLLAAIDLRLAQLLQLRDQRMAAVRARSSPAPAAGDACCNGVGAGWAPPGPMAYAKQGVPPMGLAQASSGAARLAAAKVLQLQQMQCMQLALQRELLEVLGQRC